MVNDIDIRMVRYRATVFVLMTLCASTYSLTTEELQQFHNDGSFGGWVKVTENGDYNVVEANGIPDHEMQEDNSNLAISKNVYYVIPKEPSVACTPGCLPRGPIAITKTGVAIYNPLNIQGENAVEGPGAETFDNCYGHPDNNQRYHYHKIPACGLYTGAEDEFIGVALDGFPIYGPRVSDKSELLTSHDLDECHGRFVDGKYRYHVTYDFPYFLGCFRGADTDLNLDRISYDCGDDGTSAQEYGYVCGCPMTPGVSKSVVSPQICGTTQGPSITIEPITKAPTTKAPTRR